MGTGNRAHFVSNGSGVDPDVVAGLYTVVVQTASESDGAGSAGDLRFGVISARHPLARDVTWNASTPASRVNASAVFRWCIRRKTIYRHTDVFMGVVPERGSRVFCTNVTRRTLGVGFTTGLAGVAS